ncbi:MAG TPA: RloB family protein [Caproicibacter sp.]|nr:RloB family protein [Caproicibacter sp.]
MRIPKSFGERTRTKTSDEAARKYFLVFEGDETELQYFEGIINFKNEIGINNLVEIRPLLRSYSEFGWTNPKKLLDRLVAYMQENETMQFTLNSIIDWVIALLIEDGFFSSKSIWKQRHIFIILKNYFEKEGLQLGNIVTDLEDVTNKIVKCLQDKVNVYEAVKRLSEYFNEQCITFSQGFDKMCLIVDRDKHSFVSLPNNDQYEYVKNTCQDKGYNFYVSNPCFEFWLLLHFDEVHSLDPTLLVENSKDASTKQTYAEQELRKLLHGYEKNNLNFVEVKDRIDMAIKNEALYCENIDGLKNLLGCNIGLLIKELKGE